MQKPTKKLIFICFLMMISFIITGCSTGLLRMPASAPLNYNNEQVRLLTSMAQEGILFQFDDEFLKDIPNAQISETCNSADVTAWGDQFYSVLKLFYRDPTFFKKIHIIQFKRGDKSSAEINRELDGTTYLVLTYQKIQKREDINDDWQKKNVMPFLLLANKSFSLKWIGQQIKSFKKFWQSFLIKLKLIALLLIALF